MIKKYPSRGEGFHKKDNLGVLLEQPVVECRPNHLPALLQQGVACLQHTYCVLAQTHASIIIMTQWSNTRFSTPSLTFLMIDMVVISTLLRDVQETHHAMPCQVSDWDHIGFPAKVGHRIFMQRRGHFCAPKANSFPVGFYRKAPTSSLLYMSTALLIDESSLSKPFKMHFKNFLLVRREVCELKLN